MIIKSNKKTVKLRFMEKRIKFTLIISVIAATAAVIQ